MGRFVRTYRDRRVGSCQLNFWRRPARRPVSRVLSTTLAGSWTAIPLGRASLRASRDQPGRRGGNAPVSVPFGTPPVAPLRSCSRWGLPCRRCCQRRGALLPHRFALAGGGRTLAPAVCFLWHFPWGRPRRPLAGTVFPWSPDFPPPSLRPAAAVQPSGRSREMRLVREGSKRFFLEKEAKTFCPFGVSGYL